MKAEYSWHDEAWRSLWERKLVDRLPHALLLSGAAGLGKLDFARRLAGALLCQSPGPNGQPCGQCQGCHLYAAGSHPDVTEWHPLEDAKTIKIEQIRSLGEELSLTPQYGGHKVALLHPADAMTLAASNSLLKTLEEPVAGVVIVLLSARPNAMPATIRSRCQQMQLHTPSREVGLSWLSGNWPAEQAGLALDIARDAPLQAAALLETSGVESYAEWLAQWLAALGGNVAPSLVAEQWAGLGVREVLQRLLDVTAEMIRLSMSSGAAPRAVYASLQAVRGRINSRNLFQFREQLQQSAKLDIQGLNAQALIEGLLVDASGLLASRH